MDRLTSQTPVGSVSMRIIADVLGIHVTTVSLALRGDPRVASTTRERVAETAERLGYRSNPLVQSLMKTRRSQRAPFSLRIAFLHPNSFSDHRESSIMFEGLQMRARERGVGTISIQLSPDMSDRVLNNRLIGDEVSAVVFGTGHRKFVAPGIAWERFACVAIEHTLKKPAIHRVSADHFAHVLCIVAGAAEDGVMSFGLLTTPPFRLPRQMSWIGAYSAARWIYPRRIFAEPCVARLEDADGGRIAKWLNTVDCEVLLAPPWLRNPMERAADQGARIPRVIWLASDSEQASDDTMSREQGKHAVDLAMHLIETNGRGIPRDPYCWTFSTARTPASRPLDRIPFSGMGCVGFWGGDA